MTRPTSSEMLRTFGKIGLTSFGGPAAQIAMMHDALVEDKKWLSERQFLSALSFCMLLPGPEAMQLATYCGWKLRGTWGGLLAGSLFVLPGAAVILALALGYATWGQMPLVQASFLGVKAAVVVIVLQALTRMGKKALHGPAAWMLAGASFLAIFAFAVPFPFIILAAGMIGALGAAAPVAEAVARPSGTGSLRTLLIWGGLWAAPILALIVSDAGFLTEIALFFSKLAVVTFGGAYAVLAYMTQEVVGTYGWLSIPEMVDALGLAETTPGPLILVTEFVGTLAGFKTGGTPLALAAAALVLWVTFVPCFLWIFLGAPYIDWIAARPRIAGALTAITAAVVGVILNLSLWFALHVFFGQISVWTLGPVRLPLPDFSSLHLDVVAYTLFAGLLIFGLRQSLLRGLFLTAALAFCLSFF